MVDAALIAAGFALGVAAAPHCALMCAAPCALVCGSRRATAAGFHAGRLVSYMAAGAAAAGGMGWLAAWSREARALMPLWSLLHVALLATGAWWLATGRHVPWPWPRAVAGVDPAVMVVRRVQHRPMLRAGLAGLAWVAWPCVALQGGILIAMLASHAVAGALAMAAFAIGSAPALWAAPWLWSWLRRRSTSTALRLDVAAIGVRMAGAGLVLASGWVLGRGMLERTVCWT